MLKLLITGASGFIGRNLADAFVDRYKVYTPGSAELNLLDSGATRDYLAKHKFDVVLHSATTRSNRRLGAPADMLDRNCRMFFNLAHDEDLFGKMIYFGSGAEYDRRDLPPRVSEDYFDTQIPADPYGFSKYICAKYTDHRPKIINLRLFGVFGKYEDYTVRFLSNACARVVCGLPIVIRQNVVFDYLYVQDLAKVTDCFIENTPRERSLNVCTGNGRDLLYLAQIIAEVSRKNPEIKILNSGMGPEYTADNARLLREIPSLQFEPPEQSIASLYDWYEENRNAIDTASLRYDG